MMEWLLTPMGLFGTLVSGLVGGAALWDRWIRYRNQITGEIQLDVLPGTAEIPSSNPWDPPVTVHNITDGIIVNATVQNNTSGPVVVLEWVVEGVPLHVQPVLHGEVIEAGKTVIVATQFVPDWPAWDQRLESGLTERAQPFVRVSLIALSRASSRRLTLRSAKHLIADEVVKRNVIIASKASRGS